MDAIQAAIDAQLAKKQATVEDPIQASINAATAPKPEAVEVPVKAEAPAAKPKGGLKRPQKQAVDPDSFSSAVGRGVDQLQANLGGTVEALGEQLGSEYLAEAGGNFRDRQLEEASQYGTPTIASYKDIRDTSDFGQFAQDAVAGSLPGLGAVLAGGAAGAKAPVPAAFKPAAALAGSLMASLGINIGDVQNQIKAIDPEQKSTLGSVLAGGAISLLDVGGAAAIARPLLKTLGKDLTEELLLNNGVKKEVVKEALKGGAVGAAAEAATGATQSVIGNVAAANATNTELATEQVVENAINAALGGAIVGGGVGAGAGAVAASRSNSLLPDTAVETKAFEEGSKKPQTLAGRAWAGLGSSSTKMLEPLARVAPSAKEFLRSFRADMTGKEATGKTVFEDSKIMAGGWRTKLEEVVTDLGGKRNFNKMLDDYQNNANPTTPAAQKFKALMDEIHTYAKKEGRLDDIGKIERFLPISADPTIVKARRDEFLRDILPTYGGDVMKANAAIDSWLEKSANAPEGVPNISRLVDVDPVTGDLKIDERARFDPNDPDTMKYKFSQGQIPPENSHLEKTRSFAKVPQAILSKYAKEQTNTQRYHAVSDYIEGVAHRLAFTKKFGPRGERANAMVAKAVREAQSKGYRPTKVEVSRMFDLLDAYNGMHGNIQDRGIKNTQSVISAGLTLKTLPLAALSTFVEIMTPSIRGNVMDAALSALPTIKELGLGAARSVLRGVPKSEWATVASEAGLSLSAATNIAAQRLGQNVLGQTASKITTQFFLYNGLTLLTHATRVYAAKTGDRIYQNSLRTLASGVPLTSARAQQSLSMLRSMGINVTSPAQAKALLMPKTPAEHLTARQTRVDAMHRFATQSVLEPNAADTPMWMSNNKMGLLAMLHRYPSAFTNTILPQLVRRATPGWTGTYLGSGTAAVGSLFIVSLMLSLGYAQDELKLIAKTGGGMEDTRTEMQRLQDVVGQTIMPVQPGWIIDLFSAPRYGSSGAGSLSPAVGFGEEVVKGVYGFVTNPSEGEIYKFLYKQTPAQFYRPGREAAGELEMFD